MKILIGKHSLDEILVIAEKDLESPDDCPLSSGEDGFAIRKTTDIGQWILAKLDNDPFDGYGWRLLDLGDD